MFGVSVSVSTANGTNADDIILACLVKFELGRVRTSNPKFRMGVAPLSVLFWFVQVLSVPPMWRDCLATLTVKSMTRGVREDLSWDWETGL